MLTLLECIDIKIRFFFKYTFLLLDKSLKYFQLLSKKLTTRIKENFL